jgi:hypothetical protein
MIFSKIPKTHFPGFEAGFYHHLSDSPEVIYVVGQQRILAPAEVVLAAVAAVKPIHFMPESRGDHMFKNGPSAVAGHIADVMHRVIQPNPQNGDKFGKRL